MAPEIFGVGTQAIKDNAARLGLTWSLRPGTVNSYVALTNTAMVTFDGDTVSIGTTSLIGSVRINDRIMGMDVPPGGKFIIGYVANTSPQLMGFVSSTSNSAGTVAEAVVQTTPAMNLIPNRAYEVRVLGHYTMGGISDTAFIRIRKTSLTGTIAALWGTGLVTGFGHNSSVYVSNKFQVLAAEQVVLVKTLQSETANQIIDSPFTATPRTIEVRDVGSSADFTDLVSI
jgi:hypothetical protein